MHLFLRKSFLYTLLAALRVLSFLFFGRQAVLWARNSLALGYSSPFSDLDLTILWPNEPPARARGFARFLQRTGCGETCLFAESDKKWVFLANPLEIQRDPQLLAAFGAQPSTSASRAQALVFLMRVREADSHLAHSSREPFRLAKWQFHFDSTSKLCGLPLPRLETANLAAQVDGAISAFLPNGYGFPHPQNLDDHARFLLLPHRWLASARRDQMEIVPDLAADPYVREVQQEQIKWEMWGLLSQFRKAEDFEQVHEHFRHLFLILSKDQRNELGCEEFLSYLQARSRAPQRR